MSKIANLLHMVVLVVVLLGFDVEIELVSQAEWVKTIASASFCCVAIFMKQTVETETKCNTSCEKRNCLSGWCHRVGHGQVMAVKTWDFHLFHSDLRSVW